MGAHCLHALMRIKKGQVGQPGPSCLVGGFTEKSWCLPSESTVLALGQNWTGVHPCILGFVSNCLGSSQEPCGLDPCVARAPRGAQITNTLESHNDKQTKNCSGSQRGPMNSTELVL